MDETTVYGDKPQCLQCGQCCRKLGFDLTATSVDTARWKQEGRTDILRYVSFLEGKGGYGFLWKDGEVFLDHCPFLLEIGNDKYQCDIHDTRPQVCREFFCAGITGIGNDFD